MKQPRDLIERDIIEEESEIVRLRAVRIQPSRTADTLDHIRLILDLPNCAACATARREARGVPAGIELRLAHTDPRHACLRAVLRSWERAREGAATAAHPAGREGRPGAPNPGCVAPAVQRGVGREVCRAGWPAAAAALSHRGPAAAQAIRRGGGREGPAGNT